MRTPPDPSLRSRGPETCGGRQVIHICARVAGRDAPSGDQRERQSLHDQPHTLENREAGARLGGARRSPDIEPRRRFEIEQAQALPPDPPDSCFAPARRISWSAPTSPPCAEGMDHGTGRFDGLMPRQTAEPDQTTAALLRVKSNSTGDLGRLLSTSAMSPDRPRDRCYCFSTPGTQSGSRRWALPATSRWPELRETRSGVPCRTRRSLVAPGERPDTGPREIGRAGVRPECQLRTLLDRLSHGVLASGGCR